MGISSLIIDIRLDDQLTEAARAAVDAFRAFRDMLVAWALRVVRALSVLLDGVLKVLGVVRRHEVALVAVHDGWRGLSLRHAFRPPTRGYWTNRCACRACRMRALTRA
jgi:hypothetical protein